MLDPGFVASEIPEDKKVLRDNCIQRGIKVDVDRIAGLIRDWKARTQDLDKLRHRQNQTEKQALASFSRWKKSLIEKMGPSTPLVETPSFVEWLERQDPP